ncbi:hypothetical protein KDJ21_018090 [Metabacillus litoralis]|nr:hypothetical protein [Metabacillus litoralis]UHA58729.1 hypothetical protein KDJ21_018090 [Metabacillus litoralis]
MKLGSKVIYKSEIYFFFYDHDNGLCELQHSKTYEITLAKKEDLIFVIK